MCEYEAPALRGGEGLKAVDMFRASPYDLVLMDIQMPVMDGRQATRTIRAFEQESGREPVPILALTAHAIREEVEQCLEAGCTAHLTKPIRKAVLLEAIHAWTRSAVN